MLRRVRRQMPLKLESSGLYESYEDDDDEMDEGVGTISTYKQKMIDEALYMLFAKLGLDPDDTVSRNGLVKALRRLPIRDLNEGEKVHEESNKENQSTFLSGSS